MLRKRREVGWLVTEVLLRTSFKWFQVSRGISLFQDILKIPQKNRCNWFFNYLYVDFSKRAFSSPLNFRGGLHGRLVNMHEVAGARCEFRGDHGGNHESCNGKNRWLNRPLHIWLNYKDPLLTYLLVSVPSILTLKVPDP